MRILKIMLITFILGGLLAVPMIGCNSNSESAVPENQIATVKRGDLTLDITAAGNLALSHVEDLAFEMDGTVEEVPVEEGESVEEGQLLAKLDISAWEDNIAELKDKVTVAERDVLDRQVSLTSAEIALENAEDVYEWPDIWEAQLAVSDAEDFLDYAQRNLDKATQQWEIKYWTEEVEGAEAALSVAEDKLEAQLSGYDPEEVAVKKLQVEQAQARLEDAQKAVEDAKKDLDEAQNTSPEITAPFAGFITNVNVEGGDDVLKGTVAVQLADPNEFETEILVNETDIFQVKLGGEARVEIDAIQGLSLPAKVTHISPTATIQQGVVNYKVKVELESLQAVMQERQEMMKQRQQAQEAQQPQTPAMLPQDFQLRQGLSVTVSVIVQERNDVLLVPNAAITSQKGQAYVQVVLADGTTEERAIKTGITDYVNTEVTEGLSEGEQVVVPKATTTTTTQQQRPGGGMQFFRP